jgi:hypothetical protein
MGFELPVHFGSIKLVVMEVKEETQDFSSSP